MKIDIQKLITDKGTGTAGFALFAIPIVLYLLFPQFELPAGVTRSSVITGLLIRLFGPHVLKYITPKSSIEVTASKQTETPTVPPVPPT